MTPAQAAQNDNRTGAGRYAEKNQADPGPAVISGIPGLNAQSKNCKKAAGAWFSRACEARQYADEAADESQTQMLAGVAWEVMSEYPSAVWMKARSVGRADGAYYIELSDVLDDAGEPMGQVPTRSNILDMSRGTGLPEWLPAWDSDSGRINLQQAVSIAQSRPAPRRVRPSIAEVRVQAEVFGQIEFEEKLRWVRPGADGDVTEGQLRHGAWTADGKIATSSIDPRDAHVRVTTKMGMEMFVPFNEIVDAKMNDELAWGW